MVTRTASNVYVFVLGRVMEREKTRRARLDKAETLRGGETLATFKRHTLIKHSKPTGQHRVEDEEEEGKNENSCQERE